MRTIAAAGMMAAGLGWLAMAGAAFAQGSGEPLRVGVLTDMSGLYADSAGQGSVTAAQMAADDVGGTVLGRKVEVLSADHQNKPDVGANIARQWYDVDHVEMITDLTNSGVALAVQALTKAKDKIDMVSGGGSSDLTNKDCSPNGVHWTYDTYALASGTANALVKEGGDSWFFITADYAFGHQLEADASAQVKAAGGKVLGSVRHPLSTADFSSYLLQAQASKAKVIGLANAGGDTINAIKQAAEFGIVQGGQKLAGLLVFISDIHSLGLQTAAGLNLTTPFYWNLNDQTRAWSKRFYDKMKRMPTLTQAGVYGATKFYLEAVKAAGTVDAQKVMAKMVATPINDFMTKDGHIRADHRVERDFWLVEVKKPSESKEPWDYYRIVRQIPRDQTIRPLSESVCPMVKKG